VIIPDGEIIGFDPVRDRERFTVTDKGIIVIPEDFNFQCILLTMSSGHLFWPIDGTLRISPICVTPTKTSLSQGFNTHPSVNSTLAGRLLMVFSDLFRIYTPGCSTFGPRLLKVRTV
jgi:hypothetical protein